MNSREHLSQDLDDLIKRSRLVGRAAWLVALFVMAYGTPIVYQLATDHGIPAGVAWMLSLAADGALIVGLIATPVLAQLGIPAGWVGTLRWVSGFITWALQTLSSWIAPNGPDMVGVGVHTAGPLLLFFSVEAASAFQRKIATAVQQKTRELEAAEQKDADRRAHLAELEANLRTARVEVSALTSEKEGHLREIERLTAEVASAADAGTSEIADLRASVAAAEATTEALRADYESRLSESSAAHAEEVQRLKRELRQVRAEAALPHLDDRRRGRAGGANLKPDNRSRFSDEEAVQRLLEAPPDKVKNLPSGDVREWSQQAIVDTLRVGWERSKRLVEMVAEGQTRRRSEGASGGRAVNE